MGYRLDTCGKHHVINGSNMSSGLNLYYALNEVLFKEKHGSVPGK